ncbi:MAG TPA: sialate O-acetylesterase [Allosphingosinicella sp.]|jgi:hypothetical protein
MSAKILEAVIPGLRGPSNYELWLADGNVGTIDDFLATLRGADGDLPPASNAENIAGLATDLVTTPASDKAALDARVGPVETAIGVLDAVPFAGFVKNPIVDMDFVGGRYFGERARTSLATNAPGLSFTRASTAWALGERGLYPIASGQMRLTDRGLFVGDAATNIFGATNNFTSWTVASGAAVATGDDIAPTGIPYTRVTATGSSVAARYSRTFTLATSSIHTVTVPLKAGTSTKSAFFVAETGGGTNVVQLEWTWLADGGFGNMMMQTGVAEGDWYYDELGNGDGLLHFRFTSHASEDGHSFRFAPDRALGTQSAQIAPFTITAGSMLAQPGRNATDAEDSLTQTVDPGTHFTFGAHFFEVPLFAPAATSSATICTLDDGAGTVFNSARIQYTSDRTFRLVINSGGVKVVDIATAEPAMPNTRLRPYAVINGVEVAFYVGDNLVGTASAASMPAFTRLCVGHSGPTGFRANAFLGGAFVGKGDHSAELAEGAPELPMVVSLGQSNKAGRGAYSDIDDHPTDAFLAGPQNRRGNGFIFYAPNAGTSDFTTGAAFERLWVTSNASTNTMNWNPATDTFNQGQTGPEAAMLFGRGERVLVKAAIDGTQMSSDGVGSETLENSEWSSSVSGELFDWAVAMAKAARTKLQAGGYKVKVEWLDIDQGEADASDITKANAHGENWWNAIRKFRTEMGDPTIKAAITQLHIDNSYTYKTTIRAGERMIAGADPFAYLVDVDDIPLDPLDPPHLTALGYHQRGFRIAAVMDAAR